MHWFYPKINAIRPHRTQHADCIEGTPFSQFFAANYSNKLQVISLGMEYCTHKWFLSPCLVAEELAYQGRMVNVMPILDFIAKELHVTIHEFNTILRDSTLHQKLHVEYMPVIMST